MSRLVMGCMTFVTHASHVSTVLAMVRVCLSVCLSQVAVLLKRLDKSKWCLVWRLSSTYPTVCFKEIQVSAKLRAQYNLSKWIPLKLITRLNGYHLSNGYHLCGPV